MISLRIDRASWWLALALAMAWLAPVTPAAADVLDPNGFASLGAFPAGPTLIDTGNGTSAPVLEDFGGTILATGVISNGVAVFDFSSVNTSSLEVQGSIPLALLSRGDMAIGSVTEVYNFFFGQSDATGYPGNGLGLPGARGGMGGPPGPGTPFPPGGDGGSGAVNLLQTLGGGGLGGSQFPGVNPIFGLPPTGTGGAAFELVALGSLQVGGITATGVDGSGAQGMSYPAGGGGGGGGVLLSGNSVNVTGTVDVSGGGGGGGGEFGGAGGGGGGGEIDILYGPGGFTNHGSLVAAGGAAGFEGGQDGAAGSINVVPEPASLALLVVGLAGAWGLGRRRATSRPAA